MTLGESMTELQVYPAAGVVHATSESAHLELHRVPGYTVQDAGTVVFEPTAETERTQLTVSPDGALSLRSGDRAADPPTTNAATSRTTVVDSRPQTSSHGVTDGRQDPHTAGVESEVPRTITFLGFLGRDPSFRTDTGQLVATFAVAEHIDGTQKVWHDVVTRGELAEHVQRSFASADPNTVIKQGQPVEVIGHQEPKPASKRAKPDLVASSVSRLTKQEYTKRWQAAQRR
jgi:hypothetical protein